MVPWFRSPEIGRMQLHSCQGDRCNHAHGPEDLREPKSKARNGGKRVEYFGDEKRVETRGDGGSEEGRS